MIVICADKLKRTARVRIDAEHFGKQLCPVCKDNGETTRWFDVGTISGTLEIQHKCRKCNWTFDILITRT